MQKTEPFAAREKPRRKLRRNEIARGREPRLGGGAGRFNTMEESDGPIQQPQYGVSACCLSLHGAQHHVDHEVIPMRYGVGQVDVFTQKRGECVAVGLVEVAH